MALLDTTATKPLHDTEGTVDAVLEDMATHPWVHLACHGIQDSDDPLNSAFCLYDGRLTLDMLMTKHLPNADLAVLSACQTATGDENLPDEAVHLAACLLAAGFKSTVATTWKVPDGVAPEIANRFYSRLLKGEELNSDTVARSLHYALQHIRKNNPDEFVCWISFIHMCS